VAAGKYGRIVFAAMLVGILILGGYHKYNYIYADGPRVELTAEHTHPKARGIYSTPYYTELLNGLVRNVVQYSDRDDYIFTFPYFPGLYYLMDRKNPTPLDWTYGNFSHEMWMAAMAALDKNPPKVIITGSTTVPPALSQYIKDHYQQIDRVKGYRVYIPSL
jgi:hypothetical protein